MKVASSTTSEGLKTAASEAVQDRKARLGAAAAVATGAALVAGRVATKAGGSDGTTGPSRAYRLKRKEKTAKGVRRIARGRVDHALEALCEMPDGEEAAVHAARKDLKKLRSLLRLIRGELGPATYRSENARYRDAGRLLSDARDAEVKLQTLEALGDRFEELDLDDYAAALRQERGSSSEGALSAAARAIEEGGRAIDNWNLPSGSWSPVADGFARAYDRGRNALKAVRKGGGNEAVHEWRKRSKDLWYHLLILEPTWPEILGPLADQAHELSDLLGDHHDLAVLAVDADGRSDQFVDGGREDLVSAIRVRQEELLAEALPLGERLYVDKPKAYRRRIDAYWRAART